MREKLTFVGSVLKHPVYPNLEVDFRKPEKHKQGFVPFENWSDIIEHLADTYMSG